MAQRVLQGQLERQVPQEQSVQLELELLVPRESQEMTELLD